MEKLINRIIIDKKKEIKNETTLFIDSYIEISDLLIIKQGNLFVTNCTITFSGSVSGIIGIKAETMSFHNCTFLCRCTEQAGFTKIISYKEEPTRPDPNTLFMNYSGNVDSKKQKYVSADASLCSAFLFNEVTFYDCKFSSLTDFELINANIMHCIFNESFMNINSLYIITSIFMGGHPYLIINEKGIIENCIFFQMNFSKGLHPGIIDADEKAHIKNCTFKDIDIKNEDMSIIGSSSSDEFSVEKNIFLSCKATLYTCDSEYDIDNEIIT